MSLGSGPDTWYVWFMCDVDALKNDFRDVSTLTFRSSNFTSVSLNFGKTSTSQSNDRRSTVVSAALVRGWPELSRPKPVQLGATDHNHDNDDIRPV